MIEQLIKDLIVALNANTEALNAAGAGAVAPTTTEAATTNEAATEKTAKKTKKAETKVEPEEAKPEHTQAEVNAALLKIKDDFGIEHAREILKKYKYEKMGDITPENFDAIFKAAEAKHAELTEEADKDDTDGGL